MTIFTLKNSKYMLVGGIVGLLLAILGNPLLSACLQLPGFNDSLICLIPAWPWLYYQFELQYMLPRIFPQLQALLVPLIIYAIIGALVGLVVNRITEKRK